MKTKLISPFSILFRYLFLEMLPPFFLNLAFFSFIFLMKQILDITDMVVNHKVGIGPVGLLLLYTMPYFLQYVIPMSVMMAVLMAFLRLSSDNEIMALKAGGVSVYRLLPPVLVFSLIGTIITGYMTIHGVPHSSSRFKALLFDVATANLNVGLKARTFNDSFDNIMLYVNTVDLQTRELQHVFIEDQRNQGVRNTVVARKGEIVGDPSNLVYHLRLFDGSINQMDEQDRTSHIVYFDTYDIRLDIKAAMAGPQIGNKGPKEMTPDELENVLEKTRAKKDTRYYGALLQLQKKYSIPVACIAMALLAVPLGIQTKTSKKSFGIGLGLFFFLLYYLLLSVGTAFGESGRYPPVIGMWLPNFVLGGFGIYLIVRSARENPIRFKWLATLFEIKLNRIGRK